MLLADGIVVAIDEQGRPSPDRPLKVDVESPQIRDSVDRCSQYATSKGVFGDVTVTIDDPMNPRVMGSPMLGSYREDIERCVREAVLVVARRLENQRHSAGLQAFLWPPSFAWTIGKVLPLLPSLDILVPLWEAAVKEAPGQSGKVAMPLAAVLPHGISLRKDGCLDFTEQGRAIVAGLDLWARRSGRAMHPIWFSLPFFQERAPRRPSGVLVLSDDRLIVAGSSTSGEALCIRRLEPDDVQIVLAQMTRVGTCWAGGVEELLLSPRVAFPADRVFVGVSTNGATTCALDHEGDVTCCGAPMNIGHTKDIRWRAIAVRAGGLCGVSKRGDLLCDGADDPAPHLKNQKIISQGSGLLCSVDHRDRPTCFRRVSRPKRSSGRAPEPNASLNRGLPLECHHRKDGIEVCASLQEIAPAGGSWPAVGRIGTTTNGVCVVSKDHRLVCSTTVPAADRVAQFRDVAASSQTDELCALKTDGNLSCWSLRDGKPLSLTQDVPFSELSPVMAGDLLCGIGVDGKILHARRTPRANGSSATLTTAPPDDFKFVTAGERQCCGLTTTATVLCWGSTWPGPNTWTEITN